MRLDINLATQPYEDAGRFWLRWGGGLILVVLLTLAFLGKTVSGWTVAHDQRKKMENIREQIAHLDGKKKEAEALKNRPENHTTFERSAFLNSLFQHKAFSWTMVFADLEQVMPPRLHVVSISPELGPDNQLEVKLVVAGESRERALELVHKMEDSQNFQQTEIQEEVTQPTPVGSDSVQFDITAFYVPLAENSGNRSRP